MKTQRTALLRACGSCEWIFKWMHPDAADVLLVLNETATAPSKECPKCGWGSYGARFIYGQRCYRYAKTQEMWMQRKLYTYEVSLLKEIGETNV